jgi:hypothetical protein
MSQISSKYKQNEDELITTGDRLLNQLENNPDFPNPPAALAELKTELPEFRTARANAQGRDKKMVSIKNDKKVVILALVQVLHDFVTAISNGDRTLILSSGFDVTESRSSQPPTIGKMEVVLGEAGEATTRVRNVTGVKAYVHQYATEAPGLNTIWIGEGSSDGSHTFQGLSSDKRYWFRVMIIGYNKQKAYSQVVSRVIQ